MARATSFWERIRDLIYKRPRPVAATVGCIDFSSMAVGAGYPNAWSLPGTNGGTAKFNTINPAGSLNPGPALNNRVHSQSGSTGLDCNFTLEIEFPTASTLTFQLLHTAQPAKIEAFDSAGAVVGGAAAPPAPNVVNTVNVAAAGMVRAVVHCPADETILIEFCAT